MFERDLLGWYNSELYAIGHSHGHVDMGAFAEKANFKYRRYVPLSNRKS